MGDRMIDQVDFIGGVLLSFSTINFCLSIVCILMGWRNNLSRVLLFFITLQFISGLLSVMYPFSSNAECYNATRVDEVFLGMGSGGYNLYLYLRVRTVLKRKLEHIYPLLAVVACSLMTYVSLATNERLCLDGVLVSYVSVNNSGIARTFSVILAALNDCYCLGIFAYRLSASLALNSSGRIVRLWQLVRNFTLLAIPISIATALDTLIVDVTKNKQISQEFINSTLNVTNWTPLLLGHLLLCFNRLSSDSVEQAFNLTNTSQKISVSFVQKADSSTLDNIVSSCGHDGAQDESIKQDTDAEAQ